MNGNVVRFNGNFAGSEKDSREYYHFDSWRTNVQPGLWLPTSFYVEESDSKSVTRTLKFKAINHIWGYVLKVPQKDSENTSMDVVGATDVSNEAQDLSPLGAQRAWVAQAEDNVVERLFQAGLLDAPSEFDKTLEALATNILAYNNITLSRPIHCRTLLTEPLESLSVGNTIILSKSLIDTTAVLSQDGAQQMGNLNALLAFQLAHIILGHRLDTKFAFNDRLLFPATSVFNRIPMHHTNADNEAAAKKAVELLGAKELVGGAAVLRPLPAAAAAAAAVAEGSEPADDRRWPGEERQRPDLLDGGHGGQVSEAGYGKPEAAGRDAAVELPAPRSVDRSDDHAAPGLRNAAVAR